MKAQTMSITPSNGTSRTGSAPEAARSIIEREFATPITARRLARRLRVPALLFRSTFTTAIGKTPEQYLLDRRMLEASQLLAEGHESQDVAARVGYTAFRRFLEAYKKAFRHDPVLAVLLRDS